MVVAFYFACVIESNFTYLKYVNHCLVLVRRFPVPLGQFVSVTYPRRTGGKNFRVDHVTRNALAARKNEA